MQGRTAIAFFVFFVLSSGLFAQKSVQVPVKPSSLLGTWKVKLLTETVFGMSDNRVIKGPFIDKVKDEIVRFTKDSIIYTEGSSLKKTDRYIYKKINDTVFNVENVKSKTKMKLFIRHLDASSLSFTDIRLDISREDRSKGDRYEVKIDCVKY